MTFTILGRCARTGQLGGAVTTSDIAVGARVLCAEAELGVAATQHRTDPRLGPQMLERLALGESPEQAVAAVAAGTRHRDWRQLGALDRHGRTGAYSGVRLWPVGAQLRGQDCLVLGNMLVSDAVAPVIRDAFARDPAAPLADRLLAGLAAGERAGGEQGDGPRSAALLIVERHAFPLVDLRVDDDPAPLDRLSALWDAYRPLARVFVARALTPDDVPTAGDDHRSSSTST
jgi:uncharacterized Ntn-hydrolase superfamily protein